MKPAPFDYVDPPTLDGVLAVLAEHGDDAAVIGGGQSLVPLLNLRLARPDVVIDPRRVAGLDHIGLADDMLDVGARVTASALAADERVGRAIPGLVEALGQIGHVQIRNRTTIGGSIAHADPAAELPTVLLALDGGVVLASAANGSRVVPAADFFEGAFATARRPDELVTAVRFGVPAGSSGWIEAARRPGDFALVGVFAAVEVDHRADTVTRAAVALAGMGGRPVRAAGAEAALVGRPLSATTIADASVAAAAAGDPPDDVHASAAHRRALAGVLTTRLLRRLA